MIFTAASFFTGIGGLDLAAIVSGFHITSVSEVDPTCCEILARRFPDIPNLGDIRHVRREHIPGHPTLIFGGFPCQDISTAGAGQGLRGARSGLYMELERIISDVRPQLVVLENVANVTVRGAERIVAGLSAAGYDGIWVTIPTPPDAPHIRRRWFYVAYAHVAGPVHETYPGHVQREAIRNHGVPPQEKRQRRTNAPRSAGGYRRAARRGSVQSRLELKPGVGGAAHGLSRKLDGHAFPAGSWQIQNPDEAPRLTANYPERAARIKALGNAVVPQQVLPVFRAAYEFLAGGAS